MKNVLVLGVAALALIGCGNVEEPAAPADATQHEGTPSIPGEVPSAVADATATASAAGATAPAEVTAEPVAPKAE